MKKLFNKSLIIMIVIGIIATIPLISERVKWEQTTNQVELVMDYDDIFILAYSTSNPEQAEDDFFKAIKGSVNSIGISEATLERLKLRGKQTGELWIYSGSELLDPLRKPITDREINPNHTYIIFKNTEIKEIWLPLINQFLAKEGEITEFSSNELLGVEIAAPYRLIKQHSLGIDPLLAKRIKGYGFDIVPRLSNSYIDKERTTALIEQVAVFNPTNIIFQGEEATGFPSHLQDVAELMNDNNIGLGMIELVKEQAGVKTLGYHLAHINEQDLTDNNWYLYRVHSLTEWAMKRMVKPSYDQLIGKEPAVFNDLQEQVELAVTERNIRVVYIHAPMTYDVHEPIQNFDKFTLKEDPNRILTKTVLAITDIASRLQNEGFTLGQAAPFEYQEKSWMGIARWLTLLAGIAVISLLIQLYLPDLKWVTFALGIVGIIIAKVLALESLYFKFIGLSTAVSVPVLAIKYSLEQIKELDKKPSFIHIIKLYFVTAAISFIGALLVTGMFSHVKYSLYLDQFRGVSVLYLAPLLLSLILVLWHLNTSIIEWLKGNFKNYYLFILGIFGLFALYYVARSGNEAVISTWEVQFRKLLQTQLDVRPRTKEFLLAYPIFILGIYLVYYYKRAAYLFIAAAMGQLSIVSTFTHLHTPFIISVIRTGIGLLLGLVLGLLLILGWKIVEPITVKLIRRLGL